jgi:hypothetical protein
MAYTYASGRPLADALSSDECPPLLIPYFMATHCIHSGDPMTGPLPGSLTSLASCLGPLLCTLAISFAREFTNPMVLPFRQPYNTCSTLPDGSPGATSGSGGQPVDPLFGPFACLLPLSPWLHPRPRPLPLPPPICPRRDLLGHGLGLKELG